MCVCVHDDEGSCVYAVLTLLCHRRIVHTTGLACTLGQGGGTRMFHCYNGVLNSRISLPGGPFSYIQISVLYLCSTVGFSVVLRFSFFFNLHQKLVCLCVYDYFVYTDTRPWMYSTWYIKYITCRHTHTPWIVISASPSLWIYGIMITHAQLFVEL